MIFCLNCGHTTYKCGEGWNCCKECGLKIRSHFIRGWGSFYETEHGGMRMSGEDKKKIFYGIMECGLCGAEMKVGKVEDEFVHYNHVEDETCPVRTVIAHKQTLLESLLEQIDLEVQK